MDALRGEDPAQAGNFVLLARLGSGGMGDVFLGRSPQGRTAAVKLIQPELARDPEFRRRFRLEVTATRAVAGPWTAPVLAADTESPRPWVATGFVAGLTLTEAVETVGPLPEAAVLHLAHGLVHALRDIHAAGLVHRDLKPSNVMLSLDGPVVIDFGIVRAADATAVTRTGMMVGSPGFMSPEQAHGLTAGPQSDVFGLGCVLAFAATGRPPFGSATDSGVPAVLLRVVSREPDLTGIPEPLSSLVAACLAKAPADRPTPLQLQEHIAVRSAAEPTHTEWLPPALTAAVARRVSRALTLEASRDTGAPIPRTPTVVPHHEAVTRTGSAQPPKPPRGPDTPAPGTGPVLVGPRTDRVRRPAPLRASVLVLAVVAVALAIAIPRLGEGPSTTGAAPERSQSAAPGAGNSSPSRSAPSAAADDASAGIVPRFFLGMWRGTITGAQDRRMTITQGETGATVVVTRTVSDGAKCRGTGTLLYAGESVIGLDTVVTESVPEGICASVGEQTLTRVDDDRLRYEAGTSSGILTRQ